MANLFRTRPLAALAAARAGAKHVYAIEESGPISEVAASLAKANGLHDRITVINRKSTDLRADWKCTPVRADH